MNLTKENWGDVPVIWKYKHLLDLEHLSKEEIESVGFNYGDIDEMMQLYPVKDLKEGYNTLANGEEFYYISNPALGLWAYKERFELLK